MMGINSMMDALKLKRQRQQPQMSMQMGDNPSLDKRLGGDSVGEGRTMQMLPQSVGAQNPFANYQIGQSAGHGMAQQVGQFQQPDGGMTSALRARRFRMMGGMR